MDAVAWYDEQRFGLGQELLNTIRDALSTIQQNPAIGSPVAERLKSRRLLVRRFPYSIVYLVEANQVLVLAIAHHAQRPGYWKDRSS